MDVCKCGCQMFRRTSGRKMGGDTVKRHHNDMEVGKWRSLSRKVEGTTWSLALARSVGSSCRWVPQEACSVQAPGLPSAQSLTSRPK